MNVTEENKRICKLAGITINEALKTKCLTPGAVYKTEIKDDKIKVEVTADKFQKISSEDAKELEKNLHNAIELVLSKFFV